jgi:hypothetical protein
MLRDVCAIKRKLRFTALEMIGRFESVPTEKSRFSPTNMRPEFLNRERVSRAPPQNALALPVVGGMAIIHTTFATEPVTDRRKLFLSRTTAPMADYTKYDARVDSLVMESLTNWDPSVGKLSDADKAIMARLVHRAPEKAKKICYFRSHTGFTREITVTVDDIARIYDEQTAS